MADRMRFGSDVRELKLGASFTSTKNSSFHTLKCDFKPASVDASKMATVDVGDNNQVTVTVPHLDGSGVPQTVFKGNQRPYQKECVLIIDKTTGAITLERLSGSIQVKKTRQEPAHKPAPISSSAPRPHTPVDAISNCTQRSTSRTRVTSGARRGTSGTTSALRASPPRHRTSPPQVAPWSANSSQSTLASLPMIGVDDMSAPVENHSQVAAHIVPPTNGHSLDSRNMSNFTPEAEVGVLSSSSDSSSSGSESGQSDTDGSDTEPETNPSNSAKLDRINGVTESEVNGRSIADCEPSMPIHLLSDDLCLSESGSDDDN